jgi:protein ImuB
MFAAMHAAPGEAGKLMLLAQEFSPRVEQTTPGTVALDVEGLERLYGLPQQIAAALARRAADRDLQASVAIASNPDAAVHAARGFSGVNVIPYGDEAKFLGSLPLALLSPTPEMLETLERWGIRRFRDLAALPELGLAERLGPEGLRLYKLARGEGGRPLAPVTEPLHFGEEADLEYAVELLEPLLFVLSRMLHGLCARLTSHGLATNALLLRLKLERDGEHARTLRFPVPMLDIQSFLKLLQLDLSAHPPPAPVVRIWLEAEPAKPRAAQTGLFIPLAPEPEKLEITLARLRALVGDPNVGSPELRDTHRPGAFQMLPRPRVSASPCLPVSASLPLRALRPPRSARVQMAAGQPVHVHADGVRGHVTAAAGPWRTSGDWWTADPWARDEWDVALSDGALYRIYTEQGRWFVEGSYD